MHRDWKIKVQAAFYFDKEIMNHTSNKKNTYKSTNSITAFCLSKLQLGSRFPGST